MPSLRRGHVLAGLCFVLTLSWGSARADSPLPALWEKAVQALNSGRYSEAAPLLEEWTLQARHAHTLSSEAYYNLALSYWHLKQAGKAVYYLAWSASLQAAPWNAWRTLHLLDGIQSSLGIRDSVSDDPTFRFFLLLNRNTILFLLCAAAWLVGASGLLWSRRKRQRMVHATLWGTACVALGIAGFGLLTSHASAFCKTATPLTSRSSAPPIPNPKTCLSICRPARW